jgi:cell division protein FtsI (penicillin-binding protein 3)
VNRRKRPTEPTPAAWRSRLLIGIFAMAAVALEVRLAWLQLVEADFLTAEGEQRQTRSVEMPAHRGIITDRYGEPLAVSTPVDSVYVNPQKIPLDRDLIYELASRTGRDGEDLEREITSKMDRQFVWVKRELAPAKAARVRELEIDGVGTRPEYKRFYPAGEVTCQLVGLTNTDDVGTQGLESVDDYRLAGEPGQKLVQRDEKGRVIADVEQIKPARPGRDLRTSIDLRLQYRSYLELKTAVRDSGASSGSLVILDSETGEVLTMVNQPSCNPNDDAERADMAPFRNRAITDPIEPGSTIKPLILATALAHGYSPDTIIDVPKDLIIDGVIVTSDTHHLGLASLTEILARSSSVGMATLAAELDSADMWHTLKGFGVAEATDSGLGANESHGVLEDYTRWGDMRKATLAYGYGLSITPLQLARAYAAIANGGLLPPVSFEALDAPPERVRVIAPEIAADLMAMLQVVVSDAGTARRAEIPNYSVAGKTGTARIHERGAYSDGRYRAVFVGIAPAGRPRFVAVVVINDPRGDEYYGGDVAAPVFAKVVGTALRMYGIKPDALGQSEGILLSRAEAER